MNDLGFTHVFEPGSSGITLLLLHGTGGNERDLIPLASSLDPNAAILAPRGKVDENGALRFFRRFAEGVFDLDDLRKQTQDLADFIESASDRYEFSTSKLIALGYSNGANIAASVLLSRPEVLGGGILLRAMMPFEPESLPELSGKHILVAAGIRDPMIPLQSSERLATILSDAGAQVEFLRIPAAHELTRADLEASKAFVQEVQRA